MCTACQEHAAAERGARHGADRTNALWALAWTDTGSDAENAIACGDAVGNVAAFDAGTVGEHAVVFNSS